MNSVVDTLSSMAMIAKSNPCHEDEKQEKELRPSEQAAHAVATQYLCDSCGQPNVQSLCGRCGLVRYCNRTCQTTAWKTHHKHICVSPQNSDKYSVQDQLGLTPLHYAVLDGKEKTLPSDQQAQLNVVKDSFNGTPIDLKIFLALPVSDEEIISLQMKSPGGEIKSLTQAEFLQRTGVRFKEDYLATPQAFLRLHSSPPEKTSNWYLKAQDLQVKKFEDNPPLVFLVEEPPVGLGLQAGQDFEEGDIICGFGGEFTEKASNTCRSRMYGIQPGCEQDRVSGKGIFVNDGPPNCAYTYIENFKGIPGYDVLRAVRKIQQGELFHTDYGPRHGLRGGTYFLSEQSYQEILNFCQADHFYHFEKNISNHYLESMLSYIFNASTVFIKLHLHKALDVDKTKKLMKDFWIRSHFNFKTPLYYACYPLLLDVIAKILQIKQKDAEIVNAVENLSKALSESAFVQVLLAMEKDSNFSSTSLACYQALGELYDHLYLVLNGTLTGSYLGREEGPNGEKMPNIPLDSAMFKAKYAQLPPRLKQDAKERLKQYISNFPIKASTFQNLLNTL